MKKQDFILPLSLGCMLYGIWLSFCEIFECNVERGSFLIPAFVIAGIVFFLFMPWRKWVTAGIFAVGAVAMTFYIYKNLDRLQMEIDGILYFVDRRYHKYFGNYLFNMEKQQWPMDDTLIWILISLVIAIFITIFAFRMRSLRYGLLPCYGIVAVGLMMGKTPGVRGILFLLAGIVTACFWFYGQERGGNRHFRILKVKKRGGSSQRYLLFFPLFALVLVLAVYLTEGTKVKWLSYDKQVYRTQARLEKKVIQMATEVSKYVRGAFSIDNNGQLTNNAPQYSDTPVMEITVDEMPESDIYLKGFVGSHYDGREWQQEDEEKFQKLFPDDESRRELSSIDFAGISMSQESDELYYMNEGGYFEEVEDYFEQPNMIFSRTQNMTIDYVGRGRWSGYTYVPYGANVNSVISLKEEEDPDKIISTLNKKDTGRERVSSSYSIDYIPCSNKQRRLFYDEYHQTNLRHFQMMQQYIGLDEFDSYYSEDFEERNRNIRKYYADFSSLKGRPLRGEKKELELYQKSFYSDALDCTVSPAIMSTYAEYAWDEYGYQGESSFFDRKEFLTKLKNFNKEYSASNMVKGLNTLDRAQLVQNILEREAEYSTKLSRLPAGEDYAEYFLLKEKKGFCEHFATAGTLLMRELGIPSRYVGGYMISPGRFRENKNGTYTATVLDSDAHAWTEVLAGQLGWFRIDMTPSDADREAKKKATAAPSATATPERQDGEDEEELATPTVKPTPTAAPTATPEANKKDRRNGTGNLPKEMIWLVRAAEFFAAILFLAILFIVCNRIYYNSRKKKLLHARGTSRNLYVRMSLHDMLSRMRSCGVMVSGKMPEDEWFPVIEKLCMEETEGEELISSEEQEEVLHIIQKAAFSNEEITMEEYDAFLIMCKKWENIVRKKTGKLRRAYLKITGKYGKI